MERQLPKNVRQIGNVCDEPKIYVEDYVDTFSWAIAGKSNGETCSSGTGRGDHKM